MRIILFFLVLVISAITGCGKKPINLNQQKAREDFRFLRKKIEEIHPNRFILRTAAQEDSVFYSLYNKINSSIDSLKLYDLVAEYTTFFKDGHTFPSMDYLSRAYKISLENNNTVLPFDVDFKEDYFFIKTVAADSLNYLVGSKLLSLNGHTSDEIIQQFQKYYAKRARKIDNAHVRLFKAYYWRAFGAYINWSIKYEQADGTVRTLKLKGTKEKSTGAASKTDLGTNTVMPEPFTFEYVMNGEAGLLTVNFMAYPREFEKFTERIFKELSDKETAHLIIDMRKNGGGTSVVGDILYSYLSNKPYYDGRMYVKTSPAIKKWYQTERKDHPLYDFVLNGKDGELVLYPDTTAVVPTERSYLFTGNKYLLTSAKTYSSGHMFAGNFKCSDLGIVVGQETGQATKTVGDAFNFQLPNSKIGISVSYKIFEAACELSYTDGFKPHHSIEYSTDELRSGMDKEMAFIADLIVRN